MNYRRQTPLVSLASLTLLPLSLSAAEASRERRNFNPDWSFHNGDASGAQGPLIRRQTEKLGHGRRNRFADRIFVKFCEGEMVLAG